MVWHAGSQLKQEREDNTMRKGNAKEKIYGLHEFDMTVVANGQVMVEKFKYAGSKRCYDSWYGMWVDTSFFKGCITGGFVTLTNIDQKNGTGLEAVDHFEYNPANQVFIPVYKGFNAVTA